ncbi:hypothetical protein [uncultured Algibacter sp.]|uniref:hypothetical protein n=1 Tax=uncultured Algibacter sp. TaxID=298659 RepID=UPI00263393B5|nr:hypothetical protein [uncultured Algibacter sp.]
MKPDGIANEVWFDDKALLCHTWYARHYGIDSAQTERIDNFINKQNLNHKFKSEPILFKDKFYLAKKPKLIIHFILTKINNLSHTN